ncbi:MAG: hypothetical protein GY696_41065 [Gammaproteobacteria bacterium]|nr:hypothetical protein [Gammaproteobacteria bacterium]
MDAFDDAFGGEAAAAGGSPPPMTEVDPTAEFLAKEQEDLGGLGEDLGFTSAPQEAAATQNGDMNFDFLSDAASTAEQGQEELSPLEEQGDDKPDSNSFGTPELKTWMEESSADNSQPAHVDNLSQNFNGMRVREEPESIKQWKAVEQEIRLREKDENEEKNKEELKKQAKKELEDWYKRYEEQLQKTKDTRKKLLLPR